jgi:acetyltransferase-like isoleucine patch superfamily enzyme
MKSLKHFVPKILRQWLYSFIQVYLKLIAYVPSQFVRRNALRVVGAEIGSGVLFYHGFEIYHPWKVRIGDNCSVGFHVVLDARGGLSIGSNCNISSEVAIWTAEHDVQSPEFSTSLSQL